MTSNDVAEEWVSSACTLPTTEQPTRVAEFDGLFASALRTMERPDPSTWCSGWSRHRAGRRPYGI